MAHPTSYHNFSGTVEKSHTNATNVTSDYFSGWGVEKIMVRGMASPPLITTCVSAKRFFSFFSGFAERGFTGRSCMFQRRICPKCIFQRAIFPKGYFSKVYFSKVYFSNVYFSKVYFSKLYFSKAYFSEGYFSNVYF